MLLHCALSWCVTGYHLIGCGSRDKDRGEIWKVVCIVFFYVPCFIFTICILNELKMMSQRCANKLMVESYVFWLCLYLVPTITFMLVLLAFMYGILLAYVECKLRRRGWSTGGL